jgi:hypothetical protein
MHSRKDGPNEIQHIILSIFEAVRETPGSSYDQRRFIHYLIQNSEGKRDIHKSFKGKRYFVRFIWAVEKNLESVSQTRTGIRSGISPN